MLWKYVDESRQDLVLMALAKGARFYRSSEADARNFGMLTLPEKCSQLADCFDSAGDELLSNDSTEGPFWRDRHADHHREAVLEVLLRLHKESKRLSIDACDWGLHALELHHGDNAKAVGAAIVALRG
jgi:hypothetical protein